MLKIGELENREAGTYSSRRFSHTSPSLRVNVKFKPLLEEGRTLIVIPATAIMCELESETYNKVIVWAGNHDLDLPVDYAHFLADRLIERGIATRIVGYELRNNGEELTILDIDVDTKERKVYLWLDHPAAK